MRENITGQWIRKMQSRIETILTKNIIPFWYPSTIDRDKGGYYLNHDMYGRPRGEGSKMIVTQARMVWFFSRLFNTGWGGKEYLEAADHGFSFLRDNMWDTEYGGFFWEVDSNGNPMHTNKHMYGQAFGLYALSEFFMANKSEEALDLARKLFSLLENPSHDVAHGGYREYFLHDWTPAPPDKPSYLGQTSDVKLMNTHLHLLEALITFYKATNNPLVRDRLIEMIFVLSNSVLRKNVGACTETYRSDWTPLHGPEYDRVSYGHNLENIWLLIEACKTAGVSVGVLSNFYQTVFAYSSKYGFDSQNGGIYESGPINQPADRLNKVWWVQAEGLVSEIYMYNLTKYPIYLEHFEKTLDWIEKHQVDWKNGDWFNTIKPGGIPTGNKADIWKAAYHNGRAMIETLAIFKEISAS